MTRRKGRGIFKTLKKRQYSRLHRFATASIALVALVLAFAAAVAVSPSPSPALASSSEDVMGWAWADPIGWISLNDLNPGAGGGSYGVNANLTTGEVNGFGWSENVGWVCFGSSCGTCPGTVPTSNAPYNGYFAKIDPPPYTAGPAIRNVHGWAKVCSEGDLGWVSLNCSDVNPSACGSYNYHVPFDMTTHTFTDASGGGSPANGTSFAWNGNGDGTGFGFIDFRQASLIPPPENADPACHDGMDNDLNGFIDCADPSCTPLPSCTPPPALTESTCAFGSADICCSNHIDDDANGQMDCNDTDCQMNSSVCTINWLQTKFGNVYAQQGISSIAAPATKYNATYCLSNTDGSISGFASQIGCTQTSASLTLPTNTTGYRGSLGNIDLAGIESGRYGKVTTIPDGSSVPATLDGGIYIYTGGGTLTLPAKNFQNGIGSTGRGNGLLYVKGANLNITGNVTYAAPSVNNYLRNLASFGIIVTRNGAVGGNVTIDPTVTSVAGAIFAESSISTGVAAAPLSVYGLVASRLITFQRTGGTSSTAAETVTFDGRAVANPPPGMQDIGKSLPRSKDAF